MNRAQHPSNNDVLGAPKKWNQDALSCDALPITRTEVNGMPAVICFWRPTAAELQQLQSGALVAIWTLGATVAPMSVGVES